MENEVNEEKNCTRKTQIYIIDKNTLWSLKGYMQKEKKPTEKLKFLIKQLTTMHVICFADDRLRFRFFLLKFLAFPFSHICFLKK